MNSMGRRSFLGAAAAAAALATAQGGPGGDAARIGVVGTGNRGRSLLGTLLSIPSVEVPAVCDIDPAAAAAAEEMLVRAGRPAPEKYTEGATDYRRLLARDDLDAVVIATPWDSHAAMAVDTMRAGKYAGVEVPAALTVDECWSLVNTSAETGVPCMMLENWSFRRDNLALLQMRRAGLFGNPVHAHCAYSHDCVEWFCTPDGKQQWRGAFMGKRNCDQYPTHSLGPVLSWLDIGCGDMFASLTSTATGAFGINAHFARKHGPDHPNATRKIMQGDVVTTVIRTHGGKTIVVNNDMTLPRPYDNRWLLQGTLGIYDQQRASVYLEGRSPVSHEWEPFEPYQTEFDHPWWREMGEAALRAGHAGTDYLVLALFVNAVRAKAAPPLDACDAALMSCVVGLSEQSIARGSAPVECPDFTKGAWQTRKPSFGIV
ncbi:MAG TPA: Gfo/Idh/MocA family oxidoreductase [Candidatus Hydrogenedentes bacterium]|nr:Gfo/Idh/MocA family oxidoreductase [Candidatus Hydrogenedentota bacterium]HRZ83484.1 Gfo/Idh/MocA family oxidoreductase [Candidatus Hydrogenedentota bacterium]